MTGITRLGDVTTGHDCYPARPSIQASPDVFVNGIAAVRHSDNYDSHGCGVCIPHGGVAISTSNVFINGLPVARIGDPISCGDHVGVGSSDVIAN